MCPSRGSVLPTSRFPPPGPLGRVPRLPRYYQEAPTPCRPHALSSPSAGGALGARVIRLSDGRLARRPPARGWSPVTPIRIGQEMRQGLPGSWGTPRWTCHALRPRWDLRAWRSHASVRPSPIFTGSAPTRWVLSGLYHAAYPLAVYASSGGLPRHHARLASGWMPFRCRTGMGTCWVPSKGFRPRSTWLPPFPGFAWRTKTEATSACLGRSRCRPSCPRAGRVDAIVCLYHPGRRHVRRGEGADRAYPLRLPNRIQPSSKSCERFAPIRWKL